MGRFSNRRVRMLKEATTDDGFPHFSTTRDVPMLLAFLDQFDRLGWLPPADAEKQALLAAHDVIMHDVRGDLCFYEFCSKGARGERDPWISIFFHVDAQRHVRICGVELTEVLMRRRTATIEHVLARVQTLNEWLKRRRSR